MECPAWPEHSEIDGKALLLPIPIAHRLESLPAPPEFGRKFGGAR